MNQIPYVILEAHPDYKRPYVSHASGTISIDKMEIFFLEQISFFILDRYDIDEINNITDIEKFWNTFYSDSYMANSPWDALIFIDNKWKSHIPTDEDILEYILELKRKEQNEDKDK